MQKKKDLEMTFKEKNVLQLIKKEDKVSNNKPEVKIPKESMIIQTKLVSPTSKETLAIPAS